MSSLYNRSALSPFTRADAEQVNSELVKIQAAIDALQANIADIVAGTPIASYTWVAWSDSDDGTDNFSIVEQGDRAYTGTAYNRGVPTPSSDPTDYKWVRSRGQDGSDATSGADGLSIVEKYVYKRSVSAPATPTGGSFNFSTQATTAPSGWSTGVPSGTDPVWVSVAVATKQGTGGSVGFGAWSTPALAFTNGSDGADGADGAPGSSVDVIFRRSATQPATPSPGLSTPAGWYTNVAAVPASGNPLFSSFGNRSDPTSNWTWNTPVLVEGQPGLDGNDGIDGADGKLIEFVWKRNATQPATPTGNGIPAGWSDDPPAGSDPLWMSKAKQELTGVLVAGETWSSPVRHDGPPGANGTNGTNGTNGLSNAVVYLYQRGATAPAAPSGTFTYTFTTGVLSGGTLNGWSQAIPAANGNPLWVIAATASAAATTDSIAAAEFTSPVLKDGAGLNAATVFLYQRAASAPSVPGSTLTYTFSTGLVSGTLGSWSQSVPANNGNPVYIITATALGTGATDTIATGEWSAPQILAANGANGADGSDGAPGVSPLLITLSPQALTVQGAPGGGPASGELPKYVAVTAQRGGVAKTVTAISVTAVTNCTASVSGSSVSLNTAGAGDAEITISVTADGETQTGIKIPVTVVASGADGDVAATITANTPQITSSTYAAWSPALAVNASSTGKLKVSGLCRYRVPLGLGSLQVQAKLQISADGSSWTDVSGSQVTGTTSETLEDPQRVVNGVATFPEITVTGLTANGAYQVRAQLRKTSSGDTNSESITLRIVGERVT